MRVAPGNASESDMTIGHAIFLSLQLDDPDHSGTLDHRFFRSHAACARSPSFINMREISSHHALAAGSYVIVPSTFEPNQEGDFIVRVYSENDNPAE